MRYDEVLFCDYAPDGKFDPCQLSVPDTYRSVTIGGIMRVSEGEYFRFQAGKSYRVTVEEVSLPCKPE